MPRNDIINQDGSINWGGLANTLDDHTSKLSGTVYVTANNTETQINTLLLSLTSGGTVVFKSGTYSGNYVVTLPNVNLKADGAIITGKITIGRADISQKMYSSISGFTFSPVDQVNGNSIEIYNVKRFSIDGNNFKGGDKSIYVKGGLLQDHTCEVISIQNNIMEDMNYCLYVDVPAGYTNTSLPNAEFNFSNNPSLKPNITTIHVVGTMDGLLVENNTFYMPPYGDTSKRYTKLRHIYIGDLSDFVVISGNNFFESGQESIFLNYPKDAVISNNNFGWCCESGLYSVIRVQSTYTPSSVDYSKIDITGNVFRKFSKHCVELDSNVAARVNFCDNIINFDPNFSYYYGTTALSSVNHYGIVMPTTSNMKDSKIENNNINYTDNATYNNIFEARISGVNTKAKRENRWYGTALMDKTMIFSGSSAATVTTLENMELQTNTYCGMLNITCKSTIYGDGYTTNYILSVAKSSSDSTGTLVLVAQNGKTSGADVHHPSFTFSLDSSNHLIATPVGSTTGTFYFNVHSFGDILLVT